MIQTKNDASELLSNLKENYEVYKKWVKTGFIVSIVMVILGFVIIIIGIIKGYFNNTGNSIDLSLIASIILEFIGGTAIVIFRMGIKKLNETSEKILKVNLIFIELDQIDNLPQYEQNVKRKEFLDKIETIIFKNERNG